MNSIFQVFQIEDVPVEIRLFYGLVRSEQILLHWFVKVCAQRVMMQHCLPLQSRTGQENTRFD